MSNTQSIDSLRELNVKLLAEITELRKKFAEIESENAEIPELRRNVADVEAENAKLRQIIEENAKRDSSVAVDGQSKNDKEAIAKQSVPSSCIYLNVEIKVEAESTKKCFAEDSSSDDNLLLIPNYSQGKQDQSLPSCVSDQKSLVNREIDTFLDDAHKKSVSNGIRRRNKEKLLREIASLKVLPSAENNLTISSGNDKIESSTKTVSSRNDQMSGSIIASTSKITGHEEILSWVYYSNNFENKVVEIHHETGVTDKTARTQIYKEMLEHLAENGVGIDKIKCVNCSANEISKLTNEQIQNVIDQVTSKTISLGNDQSHMPLKTTNGDASSKLMVNVSTTSRPPIPRTTYDRSYFCNKTLGQYPTIYREFSSENFDYYGITDKTSCDPKKTCPLCSLDHDDEESIEEKDNMTKTDKILTPEYLDWHAKLSGLPSILTDKIHFKLYKRYKKETGNEPWQLSEVMISISEKPQVSDFKPITFKARPDPELIIKSIHEAHPSFYSERSMIPGGDTSIESQIEEYSKGKRQNEIGMPSHELISKYFPQ
ncbi:hypothetical protein C1645_831411 [Glomus cerebriforme]|uniref:Uncharacterized protein n=1 Tax=Glomus cerebriforme TaxID=658196 RepID=A0A397SG92_9GLOM|nr:hypothetical protein C1645_831411 [Glomus cerebriforme]